ncbi:lysoplasmalogenase family protein, partial [Klebsiella pneumoniae]|uniref:lysoplasmalogenase family protein n=1 Tax=Klebsiella pneumoniae TaxID=573 RepID=UPI00226EFE9B
SKPLICISLIFILYKETGLRKNIEKLVAVGLFFGCLGDIFLMLNENMFVAGLASFLIGHILYVIAFSKQTSAKALSKHKSYIL